MDVIAPTVESPKMTITCALCNHEYDLQENLKGIPAGEGVVQFGIVCPNCNSFTHSYFETPVITEERKKLQLAKDKMEKAIGPRKQLRWKEFQEAQRIFRRKFNHEQRVWKRKKGVKVNEQ